MVLISDFRFVASKMFQKCCYKSLGFFVMLLLVKKFLFGVHFSIQCLIIIEVAKLLNDLFFLNKTTLHLSFGKLLSRYILLKPLFQR